MLHASFVLHGSAICFSSDLVLLGDTALLKTNGHVRWFGCQFVQMGTVKPDAEVVQHAVFVGRQCQYMCTSKTMPPLDSTRIGFLTPEVKKKDSNGDPSCPWSVWSVTDTLAFRVMIKQAPS